MTVRPAVTFATPANTPFAVTASTGPAAGSRITATVTRTIGGASVTLPAALVPALEPGDVVDVDFPDYRRPPSSVNYHVNVAFITETARQHWYFEHSSAADRLFHNGKAPKKGAVAASGHLHFVYGSGAFRGIPIFFIIPEDARTRGVDGVRDYVGAHPTDFVDMSQSTNAAVDQYSFMHDFLASLGSGSIDPATSRNRIETIAQSLGVSPATIDACYAAGGTQADIDNCMQQAVNAEVYQTDFTAPTQGQFLGGVAGAALPANLAPYITSLLTVWTLFVHTGHLEYEYLPTTVTLADGSTVRHDELLMGPKVPTVRPPAAASDVLFFTIGDPQATEHAPVVVNDAAANGVCERTDRFSVPLHFDHTSRYVHETSLLVTPDGRAPYAIALDPRSLDAPVVAAGRFSGSSDNGYTVALTGRFGFDPVVQPARVAMRIAFPSSGPWTIAALAHHVPVAGESLDVIASSAAAPCLSHAEMQIGSAPPVPLTATPLDDRRVELRASLAGVPAGPAEIRLYEDDPRAGREIVSTSALAIAPPPPQVNVTSAVASLGDAFLALAGTRFDALRGVLVNGAMYTKEASSTATAACFDGPPLAGATLAPGATLTAQLVTANGDPGEVFPLTLAARRPALAPPELAGAAPSVHLSTTTLPLLVQTDGAALPREVSVRLRHIDGDALSPCVALRPDPAAVTLPAADVQVRSSTALAVELRADVLHDLAFGRLQLQLVDGATGIGSPWQSIPGTFARAPDVTQIACPAGADQPCRLYGTELDAIDGVEASSGAFVAPDLDCPPSDKGVACVAIPHVAHVTVRLVDGDVTDTLPDALIVNAK
jgi:hypothetical protein